MLTLVQASVSKPSPAVAKKALANAQSASVITKGEDWRCREALAAAHAANAQFDEAISEIDRAIKISWGPARKMYRLWKSDFENYVAGRIAASQTGAIQTGWRG